MAFRTKLDFSDNRQVKQRIETTTNLSGATTFGVPFSDLPFGPNPTLSSITQTLYSVASTFSGNNTTSIFTWGDSRMVLGESALSAITPSNSGVTQETGIFFTPDVSSFFNIDGNTGYTHYTGVSYSVGVSNMSDLGGGNYSGNVSSQILEILETTGLDFTGRTIWNDVSGITRTNKLIITNNPQVGYVLTCMDSEGMVEWQPSSGSSSGSTIWTAGTGVNSAVLGGSGGIASGSTSVSEGENTIAGGDRSHAEGNTTKALSENSHAEGEYTIASGTSAHAEGFYSRAYGYGSHAEGGYLDGIDVYSGGTAIGNASHAEGYNTTSGWKGFNVSYISAGLIVISDNIDYSQFFQSYVLVLDNDVYTYNTINYTAPDFTIQLDDTNVYNGYYVADLDFLSSTAATTTLGNYAHAQGKETKALGNGSHAQGNNTKALGEYSHAEGYKSKAVGINSHAEGGDYYYNQIGSTAWGNGSHAEGRETLAYGGNSHVEGYLSVSYGEYSHAEGYKSLAFGNFSHAEGGDSSSGYYSGGTAWGVASHAEGIISLAYGYASHAEGGGYDGMSGGTAWGVASHAEGIETLAYGEYSHAEGIVTRAIGNASHAEGNGTDALSDNSHAEGSDTVVSGTSAHAEGDSTIAGGEASHAEGQKTYAFDKFSHAEGQETYAEGEASHAEGFKTKTLNDYAHAEGRETIAEGLNSHAEGHETYALGETSHAEGYKSLAYGISSHAEGGDANYGYTGGTAWGNGSHAEGVETLAYGYASHAQGQATDAYGDYSHAGGYFSKIFQNYGSADYSFIHSKESTIESSEKAVILGGYFNILETSDSSTILGGENNNLYVSTFSDIIGGSYNTISGGTSGNSYNMIFGGTYNEINNHANSFIIGGSGNTIHFDLDDIAVTNNFESIINSRDCSISASTNVEINNSVGVSIGDNILSSIRNSYAINFTEITGNYTTDNSSGLNLIDTSIDAIINGYTTGNAIISSSDVKILGTYSGGNSFNNVIIGSSSVDLGAMPGNIFENTKTTTLGCDGIGYERSNYVFIGASSDIYSYTGGYLTVLASKNSNIEMSTFSTILGGRYQTLGNVDYSSILGGSGNTISASTTSAIIAGSGNTITNNTIDSAIIAGSNNKINGHNYSVILGGTGNTIDYDFYTGENNSEAIISSYDCVLSSTTRSGIMSSFNSIVINSYDSTVIGGRNNNITQCFNSAIIGGEGNTIGANGTDTDNVVIIACSNYNAGSGNNGLVVVPQLIITGLTSVSNLQTNASGQLVNGTSDANLKQNIQQLPYGLEAIKQLRGVSFEYTPESNMGGGVKYGFIAQEVQKVLPTIVRPRVNDANNLSLDYNEIVPILVEAVKELSSGITTSNNTHLETQTILAEDNNIELNFNGTQQTAIGGGLTVLHAKGQDLSADLITDNNGDFVTNNDFKPQALTIPLYTPTSSNDTAGSEGNITRDDNFIYIKTSSGWKRTNLENF